MDTRMPLACLSSAEHLLMWLRRKFFADAPCFATPSPRSEILKTTRKGKRLTPQTIRARMCVEEEEEEEGEDEDEPITGKRSDNIGVQNDEYFACAFVHNCSKRLRRSERDLQWAMDHAHPHTAHPWYGNL